MTDVTARRSGVVGVLRATNAVFEHAAGSVLDVEANAWIELSPLDDRSTTSIAAVGRRLFQFGGARSGRLLNDAWVWTPPAAAEAIPATTTPTPPPTTPTPPPTTPTPPTTSAATPLAGAPQYLSASGDASAGRVTVRCDRPVTGDAPNNAPGGGTIPQDKTTPMSLIIFGSDRTCATPAGNGHEYLDGLGTATVTTDATSLVPGTTYIGIGARFVKSAADGTFNDPVRLQDGGPSTSFPGMSCIPIPVS